MCFLLCISSIYCGIQGKTYLNASFRLTKKIPGSGIGLKESENQADQSIGNLFGT